MMKEQNTVEPNFHLKVSLSIIYCLGTWPPRAGRYRYLYLLYTVCSFTFIMGILLAAEIGDMLMNWKDMSKIAAGATVLMTNSVHASKIIVLLTHQSRIRALLDLISSPIFNRNDKVHHDLLVSYTRKGLFHHAAYQSFGAIAIFCWGITPIADMLAGRSRRLPMDGWYPYNVTRTPAFEITSVHQEISLMLVCFHNVSMDTLITGMITVACCQLAILERNIVSIGNEKMNARNDKSQSSAERKALSYRILKQCAVHSNTIHYFAREIQDIFGTIIFLQFLSNCVIICLLAFNVSQMKTFIPEVLLGMVTYMCCMTYQIFIFCWHGNELNLHSVRIVMAAYSSNWFSAPEGFKRNLQIVMMRAHRPLTLSAGNLMLLSLDTFVEVCVR